MANPMVEKIKGGFRVDGLDLLRSNCGCGGLTGPGGSGVGDCCLTYSTVKQEANTIYFVAKGTTPNTIENYECGYRVRKGDVEVDVHVYDTRGPKNFRFGGKMPPRLSDWQAKGWQVIAQFERPLEGTGEPMPEWCSPEACLRPDRGLESPHGEMKK